MTKGKFGLAPSAIAVIAFVFVMLNQPLAVLLVAGFALLAEKDEWLNRQVLQAVLLSVVYNVAVFVLNLIFGFFDEVIDMINISIASVVYSQVRMIFFGLLSIALLVFVILAIVKLMKGKDAGIPVLSKLVGDKQA